MRVLLIDDHAVQRKDMVLLLGEEPDIAVVGEAGDGEEAIAQVRALQPDAVIMDITMPGLNGIEATRQIVASSPHSKVIGLSIHFDKRFVDDMLNAGAAGYLLKESVPEELPQCIRAVMRGHMYLGNAITGKAVSAYAERMSDEHPADSPAVASQILRTKLHRPGPPVGLVPRTHPIDRLEAGRARPLTLVSAPAGYGKSVLVSSWLESCDWPSTWLSLDKEDGDLLQFLRYFVASVQCVFPDACKHTMSLTNTENPPPLPTLAGELSNELEALDQPFLLVLDDYHRIDARSTVNDLLHRLLARPPIPLHLVIVTRRDPPLQLLTLRAQNQVTEIRMRELRFTQSETRALLQETSGFIASNDELAKLQSQLEGWVVGLRLVSLALHHFEDRSVLLNDLHGGAQPTQDYLVREVIASQPPDMQEWLLKAAILDRFCGPLCDAVCRAEASTGTAEFGGAAFISTALGSNLFAIPLDAKGEWVRYHHLFQKLLLRELNKRLTPDEIAELHARASQWFESHDLVREALEQATASGDLGRAAQIVERKWRAMMNEGNWHVAVKWLSQLPESLVQERPQLLLIKAWKQYYHLEISALPSTLDRIDHLMGSDAATHDLSGEIAVFRGFCTLFQNEGARSLEYIEYALSRIQMTDVEFRGQAEILFALAGQMEGEKERVTRTLTEWLNAPSPLSPLRETCLLWSLFCVHYISVNPEEAERHIPRLREVAGSYGGGANFLAWCDYFEGLIFLQQGELDMAIRVLEEASSRKHFHYTRAAIDSLIALTFAYQAHGQSEQAAATLKSLREFANHLGSSFMGLVDSCAARLSLMQNRREFAGRWLETDAPPSEVMVFWLEVPAITRCRALIAQGSAASLKEALERLQEYAKMNEAHHNTCQQIGILALQAMVFTKQGKQEQAHDVLERAITLARPGGFIFPFLELGRPMADLLKELPAQDDNAAFVEQSLSAFDEVEEKAQTPARAAQKSQPFSEPLTHRELDILELLAQRLQNKEIAAKLFVSPETVKTHLKHLYQKLDVSNRREAAAKAVEIIAASTGVSHATDRTDTK